MANQQQQYDRSRQYNDDERPREPVAPLILKPEDIEEILELMANGQRKFSPAEIKLICDTQQTGIAFSLQLTDFKRLMYLCSLRDLNPLANEIHIEYRFDKQARCAKAANVTHIDGYRKIAAATGQLDGREVAYGEDAAGNLIWAEAIVYRKDCQRPFKAKCWKSEFLGDNYMHRKMPHAILGKDAEASALRAAFAAELAGLVVEEEMQAPAAARGSSEDAEEQKPQPQATQPTNGGGTANVGGFQIGVQPEASSQAPASNGTAQQDPPAPTTTAPAETQPQQKQKEPTIQERVATAQAEVFSKSKLKANALRAFMLGYFDFPDTLLHTSTESVAALKGIAAERVLPALENLLAAFKSDERSLDLYGKDPRRLGKQLRPKPDGEQSAPAETAPAETNPPAAETNTPAPEPEKPKAETKAANGTNGGTMKTNAVDLIAKNLGLDKKLAELAYAYCTRHNVTVQQAVEQWKSAGVVMDGADKWQYSKMESFLMVAIHATNAHELVAAHLRDKSPMALLVQDVEKRIGKRLLTDGKPTDGIDQTTLVQAISAVASEGAKPGLF